MTAPHKAPKRKELDMFLQFQEFVWTFWEALTLLDWLPGDGLEAKGAASRGTIEPTG